MTGSDFETAKIAKVTGKCPACEDYAEKNSTQPPKIAVMACEGACARGEVARRAANLVAHRLARDETVRICLGGAFTKDTGQRNLVRRADRVIAIEGCFINCSSRMMQGVLPDLEPEIVRADLIYNLDLPFGIDEVPDEMFTIYAHQVADTVVREYLSGSAPAISCGADPAGGCGVPAEPASCCAGPSSCSPGPAAKTEGLQLSAVNVRWAGDKRFTVENARGGSMIIEEGAPECTPYDAFMAALGSCVNLAVLNQMQKRGTGPGVLTTEVSATRTANAPYSYEKIHIAFTIETDMADTDVTGILEQAITVLCPVAVTLGRAADITWEFRRA
jgi:uncharacterized OsmC-like protein/uncharacterized metal-binding protein